MIKLYIRVKFRALGVTFGTVERTTDIPLTVIVALLSKVLPVAAVRALSALDLANLGRIYPDDTITLYDDRGVLIQLPK